MTNPDRLSPLDAAFVTIEDDHRSHMHIASCATFEGPAPSVDEATEAVAGRLPLSRRYRQVLRFPPFGAGRPVWVDDPAFDIAHHVHRRRVPSPGGTRELDAAFADLMAIELDRAHPLWETWILDGLRGGRWALVSKMHHCMVDGMLGTALSVAMLDPTPELQPPMPDDWAPAPPPSPLALLADGARDTAEDLFRLTLDALGALRRRPDTTGVRTLADHLLRNNDAHLNGPVGPDRRWCWTSTSIDHIRAIRTVTGGTLNDVVLAAMASGYRSFLLSRGEAVDGTVVRTMMPINARNGDEGTKPGNIVRSVFVDLPVGDPDPVSRLTTIAGMTAALKCSGEPEATEGLIFGAGRIPAPAYNGIVRLLSSLTNDGPMHAVNTVVTNIHGPQFPLWFRGRRMLHVRPFVPIAEGILTGTAVFSYDGELSLGFTGDADQVPDLHVLRDGVTQGFRELPCARAHRRNVTV
jgi:WS/DGAT/MGAT family acyltransferase